MRLYYLHVGTEVDGRWTKQFLTFEAAETSLREYALVSEDTKVVEGKHYESSIGGYHFIMVSPLTARQSDRYNEYCARRECGEDLTDAQKKDYFKLMDKTIERDNEMAVEAEA